jgi:hypothetical protein
VHFCNGPRGDEAVLVECEAGVGEVVAGRRHDLADANTSLGVRLERRAPLRYWPSRSGISATT